MAAGEQKLAIELLALMGLMTLRDLANHGQVPHPRKFVAALAAFAVLSGVGKFGPSAQRLADILGAVVVIGWALAWVKTKPTDISKVAALPAAIASGKGLPTTPTAATPHKGLTIFGELLELLAVASLLRGATGVAGGGGGGGTEGETAPEEPGAETGGLSIPEVAEGIG